MVKFTFNTTLNLNIPWCDCYGWASGQGVHFILNSTTIASFWKTGEIDRNDLDVEDDDGVSVQRDGLTYKYSEVCNESSGD